MKIILSLLAVMTLSQAASGLVAYPAPSPAPNYPEYPTYPDESDGYGQGYCAPARPHIPSYLCDASNEWSCESEPGCRWKYGSTAGRAFCKAWHPEDKFSCRRLGEESCDWNEDCYWSPGWN